MRKAIVILWVLMCMPLVMAASVEREAPDKALSGSQFNVTYEAHGLGGKFYVLVHDTVAGNCTFAGGSTTYDNIILEVGKAKRTVAVTAPAKNGSCKFSGYYRFADDAVPTSFANQTVYIGSKPVCKPKKCNELKKQCGQWDNGCGSLIYCGTCEPGKVCNNGKCEVPKPMQFQQRYENATFTFAGIDFGNVKAKVYEKFSFIRNRLSGLVSARTEGNVKCDLNKFRLQSGNLTTMKIQGTAELNCRLPVDLKITPDSIEGLYNGTIVFRLQDLK
jgi:hypothetical protein